MSKNPRRIRRRNRKGIIHFMSGLVIESVGIVIMLGLLVLVQLKSEPAARFDAQEAIAANTAGTLEGSNLSTAESGEASQAGFRVEFPSVLDWLDRLASTL